MTKLCHRKLKHMVRTEVNRGFHAFHATSIDSSSLGVENANLSASYTSQIHQVYKSANTKYLLKFHDYSWTDYKSWALLPSAYHFTKWTKFITLQIPPEKWPCNWVRPSYLPAPEQPNDDNIAGWNGLTRLRCSLNHSRYCKHRQLWQIAHWKDLKLETGYLGR